MRSVDRIGRLRGNPMFHQNAGGSLRRLCRPAQRADHRIGTTHKKSTANAAPRTAPSILASPPISRCGKPGRLMKLQNTRTARTTLRASAGLRHIRDAAFDPNRAVDFRELGGTIDSVSCRSSLCSRSGAGRSGLTKATSTFRFETASAISGECPLIILTSICGSALRSTHIASGSHSTSSPDRKPERAFARGERPVGPPLRPLPPAPKQAAHDRERRGRLRSAQCHAGCVSTA